MGITKCDIFGHRYRPYEHGLYELVAGRDTLYNRVSLQRLRKVYCTRCGITKDVVMENDIVKYKS